MTDEPSEELHTLDPGAAGTGLGCLSGIIFLSGVLHLWCEYDFWASATQARFSLTGWQVLSHVLFASVAACSFLAIFWTWRGRPSGWRQAFLSLRVLLYSYLLLAYYALHEATVLDAQGWGSQVYGVSFLFWSGMALFTLIGLVGMLRPSVLAACGVSPPERTRRPWWHLTWWP